ncbi:MAG: hypothetical protein mread185_000421 [Mycoplasmataceae bacterium]|nr:MAG: hypothetical protein mread185_000421 [Mycoplasmataceae bacterium]
MTKKIHWGKFVDAEEISDNEIKISGEKTKKMLVKVVDEKDNEIKRYQDIKVDKHKILISMNFQWGVTDFQETNGDEIEYFMKKKDDYWKIDEGNQFLTVIKKDEFKKIWKEMHWKLLQHKFNDKVEKIIAIDGTDMKYRIPDNEGSDGFGVIIYFKDGTKKNRFFSWDKVKIESDYYQNKKSNSTNAIPIIYQKGLKKSPLTKGWFVFFTIMILAIVGLIFFWKEIWLWIKGESKQEKKIREQLDIF